MEGLGIMPEQIQITVNGQLISVPKNTSVLLLLKQLGLDQNIVFVELNKNALLKKEYEQTILQPNDRLELVRVTAGG